MSLNRIVAALVVTADRSPYIAAITVDADTIQSIVGGDIEAVRLADGLLYCNRDGKVVDLPFNRPATELARTTTPDSMNRRDRFYGTCVVVGLIDPSAGDLSAEDVSDVLVEVLASLGWRLCQPG